MKTSLLISTISFFVLIGISCYGQETSDKQDKKEILLKDYRPRSIYNVPQTEIERARFDVIDFHSHSFAKTDTEIAEWVDLMDEMRITKTIILGCTTGADFDTLIARYGKYGDKFDVWCGFDYTAYNEPGFAEAAIQELERCYKMGAKGVGELGDKGMGMSYSRPTRAPGMHFDDPRMKPLFAKCAELNMPVNIHIADPYWMYLPVDEENDGLMNAERWQIKMDEVGKLGHQELINTLENAVRDNPKTTFVVAHFANCSYNLQILGELLDKYPNLYADNSARYQETATIPRYMKAFYEKYQDRILYGTDNKPRARRYNQTFRILETADEHIYNYNQYHWASYGFNLDDRILKKIYYKNAEKILGLSN
jgi:predicted TIM-barrel fold metal-dependent hydrolase